MLQTIIGLFVNLHIDIKKRKQKKKETPRHLELLNEIFFRATTPKKEVLGLARVNCDVTSFFFFFYNMNMPPDRKGLGLVDSNRVNSNRIPFAETKLNASKTPIVRQIKQPLIQCKRERPKVISFSFRK